MGFIFFNARKLKRSSGFPVTVSRLYSCARRSFPLTEQSAVYGRYEVTLRLDSDHRFCRDEIDGRPMDIPFPNVVFKSPGMKIKLADGIPREAIGFSYSPEVIRLLRSWGLFPEKKFMPLPQTPEFQYWINAFRKFIRIYPALDSPGDRIDGICFNILREILFDRPDTPLRDQMPEVRINEAKLYLRQHFDEKLNLDDVADKFGFSHASFYQNWKKAFRISPHRYIEDRKLEAAAFALLQTKQPLSIIVREFAFSCATSFHRKFKERFGVTPAEFRRERERWEKCLDEFSDD